MTRTKIVAGVSILAILIATTFAVLFSSATAASKSPTVGDKPLQSAVQAAPDSGVMECHLMATRAADGNKSSETMTESAYKEALAPFQNSAHADLKEHGTKFVEVVYKAQGVMADDNASLEDTMGALMAIKISFTGLQTACKNHGVPLPNLVA